MYNLPISVHLGNSCTTVLLIRRAKMGSKIEKLEFLHNTRDRGNVMKYGNKNKTV